MVETKIHEKAIAYPCINEKFIVLCIDDANHNHSINGF